MLGTNEADKYTLAITKGNVLVVIIDDALSDMSLSIIFHSCLGEWGAGWRGWFPLGPP